MNVTRPFQQRVKFTPHAKKKLRSFPLRFKQKAYKAINAHMRPSKKTLMAGLGISPEQTEPVIFVRKAHHIFTVFIYYVKEDTLQVVDVQIHKDVNFEGCLGVRLMRGTAVLIFFAMMDIDNIVLH